MSVIKCRLKTPVIEAMKWNPESKPDEYPEWFWDIYSNNPNLINRNTGRVFVESIDGWKWADAGDYLLKEDNTRYLTVLTPEVFAEEYKIID